jgi:hypothetical protein
VPAINKLVIVKEIVRIDVDTLPDSKRSFNPLFHLSNGLQLRFVVKEIEPGAYGIVFKTIKSNRRKRS